MCRTNSEEADYLGLCFGQWGKRWPLFNFCLTAFVISNLFPSVYFWPPCISSTLCAMSRSEPKQNLPFGLAQDALVSTQNKLCSTSAWTACIPIPVSLNRLFRLNKTRKTANNTKTVTFKQLQKSVVIVILRRLNAERIKSCSQEFRFIEIAFVFASYVVCRAFDTNAKRKLLCSIWCAKLKAPNTILSFPKPELSHHDSCIMALLAPFTLIAVFGVRCMCAPVCLGTGAVFCRIGQGPMMRWLYFDKYGYYTDATAFGRKMCRFRSVGTGACEITVSKGDNYRRCFMESQWHFAIMHACIFYMHWVGALRCAEVTRCVSVVQHVICGNWFRLSAAD